MKKLIQTSLVAVLVFNSSCVVHRLKVDKPADSFFGLAEVASSGDDIGVFVTHGMGISFLEFADPVIKESTRRMGFTAIDTAYDTRGPGFVKILTYEKADQVMKFYIRGWFPATWEKWVLDWVDNNSDRLPAMDDFKSNLMNQSISDVIMYQGSRRDEIKEGVEYTLEKMVNDNPDASYVAITESLGSKIFVETVNDNFVTKSAWALELQSSLKTVYMLSNQLPLLFLGDIDESPKIEQELRAKSAETHEPLQLKRSEITQKEQQELLSKAYEPLLSYTSFGDRSDDKVQLVAFSDPNDLLSYQVPEDAVYAVNYDLVNVRLSIAEKGFSFPFGRPQIVNPLKAHLDYQKNKKLVKYLVNGHPYP